MIADTAREHIGNLWKSLYGGEKAVLHELYSMLDSAETALPRELSRGFDPDGLVYSCYADAFGDGLDGVKRELPRLASLGVTILWLLPLLDSPDRDQGFDIRDYGKVHPRFGGNEALGRLLADARERGIQIVFDIAINHTSDEHPWFRSAVSDPGSPYRGYYHFSPDATRYANLPIIFPDMVKSVWSPVPGGDGFYLHRFYPFQPDLNYGNPRVAFEMIRILSDWKLKGVNGFRMDAASLLWKEEGTSCDNLSQTHVILKLFRACLDAISPGTLFLAEANLPPPPVMDYFAQGDECQAVFHFGLMPLFWRAFMERNPDILLDAPFPPLPQGCRWFTFLRCHDEVTLDLVEESLRPELVSHYAKNPLSPFRNGQAFSGRLFSLLEGNPDRVLLAFSLLFSLAGTPVLYYGDEIAMPDNDAFMEKKSAETGFRDSRFLHRGPFDQERSRNAEAAPDSPEGRVARGLANMASIRRDNPDLVRAEPAIMTEGKVLRSTRSPDRKTLVIWNNLSASSTAAENGRLSLAPYAVHWSLA